MEFYIKLSSIEDDKKLSGIILFEEFGKTLTLGIGKSEYTHYFGDEYYVYRVDEIERAFNQISAILPNARICYDSGEDEGSGESDVMLKKENDPQIYHCSTLWCDDNDDNTYGGIGSDAWCEQVICQSEDEEDW